MNISSDKLQLIAAFRRELNGITVFNFKFVFKDNEMIFWAIPNKLNNYINQCGTY